MNPYLPIPIPTPKTKYDEEVRGYELLFSISSAEIALFQVEGNNLLS